MVISDIFWYFWSCFHCFWFISCCQWWWDMVGALTFSEAFRVTRDLASITFNPSRRMRGHVGSRQKRAERDLGMRGIVRAGCHSLPKSAKACQSWHKSRDGMIVDDLGIFRHSWTKPGLKCNKIQLEVNEAQHFIHIYPIKFLWGFVKLIMDDEWWWWLIYGWDMNDNNFKKPTSTQVKL